MKQPRDSSFWIDTGVRLLPSGADIIGMVALLTFLVQSALPATAQVKVIRELKHDVSAPMRDVAAAVTAFEGAGEPESDDDFAGTSVQVLPLVDDPAIQRSTGNKLLATLGLNLLGLGSGFTGPQGTFKFVFAPPDPNAAVGATQVLETVNLSWAVFDKSTGATLLGPVTLASIWSGFNTSCSAPGKSLADPIVLYDKLAQRWMIKIVTLGNPYLTCVAVSTTSDATGSYNRYAFQLPDQGNLTGQKFGLCGERWSHHGLLRESFYAPKTISGLWWSSRHHAGVWPVFTGGNGQDQQFHDGDDTQMGRG